MVEAEVPYAGVDHAVCRECEDSTNNGSGQKVVPVVVGVDGERSCNQASSKNRHVSDDQLPHGRMVVAPDLELGVEVEVQKDEACECSSCVSAGHRFEGIVDFVFVSSADFAIIHDVAETIASLGAIDWGARLANCEKVWAKTTNQPWWTEVSSCLRQVVGYVRSLLTT